MCVAIIAVRYKNESNESEKPIECDSISEVKSRMSALDENELVLSYSVFVRTQKFERVNRMQKVAVEIPEL